MPNNTVAAIPDPLGAFIARWDGTEQAERANYARFLDELCDVLGVPRPEPAAGPLGDYRYERSVTHREPELSRRDPNSDTQELESQPHASRMEMIGFRG